MFRGIFIKGKGLQAEIDPLQQAEYLNIASTGNQRSRPYFGKYPKPSENGFEIHKPTR